VIIEDSILPLSSTLLFHVRGQSDVLSLGTKVRL